MSKAGKENKAELWRRIGFVLAALLVYRLGIYVSLSGIDYAVLANISSSSSAFWAASSGVFARVSIFALGIVPYITASFFVQVFIWVAGMTPKLIEVERRARINTYIRVLTIILTLLQGYMLANALIAVGDGRNTTLVSYAGPWFVISTMLTLTASTMFLVWLADEITKRGLGNGVILILAAVLSLYSIYFSTFPLFRM